MSYRPPFSYWLTVTIPSNLSNMPGLADAVSQQVREATENTLYELDRDNMPESFAMRVNENAGTVPQNTCVDTQLVAVSKANPLLTFDLTCLNEEDKSEQHHFTFKAGKTLAHNMARLIEADDFELQELARLTLTRDRAVYLLRRLLTEISAENKDPVRQSVELLSGMLRAAVKPDGANNNTASLEDLL